MVIGSFANFFVTQFFAFVLKHPLKMTESKASPARNSLGDIKVMLTYTYTERGQMIK